MNQTQGKNSTYIYYLNKMVVAKTSYKLGDISNGRVSHVGKCVWSEKISVESKQRVVGVVIRPK